MVKYAQALMYFLLKIREYFLEFHANWSWKPIHTNLCGLFAYKYLIITLLDIEIGEISKESPREKA